jgi:hypothetical protein
VQKQVLDIKLYLLEIVLVWQECNTYYLNSCWSGGIAPRIHNPGIDGDEWSASHSSRFALGERSSDNHWIRCCMGLSLIEESTIVPYLKQLYPVPCIPMFSSGLLPSGFPNKFLYAFLFSSVRTTCYTPLMFLNLIMIIFGKQYKLWSSSIHPFMWKYYPQQTFLKHFLSTWFPWKERPSFTPMRSNRQGYSFVYFNVLYIEWMKALRFPPVFRGILCFRPLAMETRVPVLCVIDATLRQTN